MIKELIIGDESIVIDFEHCPAWKVIAIYIGAFVIGSWANKKLTTLVEYKDDDPEEDQS
jgi:hypothetical protein